MCRYAGYMVVPMQTKLMLIDDDRALCEAMSATLTLRDYDVTSATLEHGRASVVVYRVLWRPKGMPRAR